MIEYICSYCEEVHNTTNSFLNHLEEKHEECKELEKTCGPSVEDLVEDTMENFKYVEAKKNVNSFGSATTIQLDNVITEFKQIIDGKPQNNVFQHNNAQRSNNSFNGNTNPYQDNASLNALTVNEEYPQNNHSSQQSQNNAPSNGMSMSKNQMQTETQQPTKQTNNNLFPQGVFMNGMPNNDAQQNMPQNIPPFINNNQFDQDAFQKFIQTVCSQGNNQGQGQQLFPGMTTFTTTSSNVTPGNNTQHSSQDNNLDNDDNDDNEISDTDSDPNYDNRYYRFMLEFAEKSSLHNVHMKELYKKFCKWYPLVTATEPEDVPSVRIFNKKVGEFYDIKKSVNVNGKHAQGIEGLNYKKPDEIFDGLI
jgi:hypothetical protein